MGHHNKKSQNESEYTKPYRLTQTYYIFPPLIQTLIKDYDLLVFTYHDYNYFCHYYIIIISHYHYGHYKEGIRHYNTILMRLIIIKQK